MSSSGKQPASNLVLTEEQIDDLLYFARTGDTAEFNELKSTLCAQNHNTTHLLEAALDHETENGILHMAAANGHTGSSTEKPFSIEATNIPSRLTLANLQRNSLWDPAQRKLSLNNQQTKQSREYTAALGCAERASQNGAAITRARGRSNCHKSEGA